ncbi:hypothetical protein DBR37_06445 [Herminiimonas sp. KBW02]|uniref:ImmA/IrrE family metallo-endopeptidase n=1 Tax=Herminiimonas sp. KBW02 TaxID=2153363 RepID=UPI000F596F13|nr:ImmA/IrrE family metallo-endopeptidase [Herminiimonas sp. KBW02]RQO35983.1 hypothetical protein DBR37_06445 [Herminiimonas sp. KBW02]
MTEPNTPYAWGSRLATIWQQMGMSFPINVSLIASEYTTRYPDPISKIKGHDVSGIEGMLIKRESKTDWVILYDATVEVPGRLNFTLAHELGHYFLHRHLFNEFKCGQDTLLDYESKNSRKREAEANKFAGYLLMPLDDFRKQIVGETVTLNLLSHCAKHYGTSLTATTLKWLEFTEEAAMLVVGRDDFICWSYPSPAARKLGAYLSPGSPVPDSAIERLNCGRLIDGINTNIRVAPGVWHSSQEAEESILLSDRYELAIFLVRFPLANFSNYDEEDVMDSFQFLSERSQGLNWKK